MKLNVGDKVAVIDDILKGQIIAINAEKVLVETTDGFSFEFTENELVVIKTSQSELAKFSDITNRDLLADKEKESTQKKSPKFKSVEKMDKIPPMEVDLHIHHLVSTTKGMDTYDKLNLQAETAKKKIEFAIRNRIPKIVFIHGVGEGVLKKELEFIFKNYKVEAYPASFKKYGLGATEIYIYQNR